QIHDRNAVAHSDLLRTQNFLYRLRIPRTGFDRRVVRNNDTFTARDLSDNGHDRGSRSLSVIFVIGNKQPDLLRKSIRVKEQADSLTRRQLSLLMYLVYLARSAAEFQLCFESFKFGRKPTEACFSFYFHRMIKFLTLESRTSVSCRLTTRSPARRVGRP